MRQVVTPQGAWRQRAERKPLTRRAQALATLSQQAGRGKESPRLALGTRPAAPFFLTSSRLYSGCLPQGWLW